MKKRTERIIEMVERFHDLKLGTLQETRGSRKQPNCWYRHEATYLIKKYTTLSLKEVAAVFDKCHATPLNSIRKIKNHLEWDKAYEKKFSQLDSIIGIKSKGIVLIDIDGTISKVGDRLKYIQQKPEDWDSFYDSCFDDEPIEPILKLINDLYILNYQLVFCTGRRESCRDKTIEWLNKYLPKEAARNILMRANNDFRHDTEVKPDLLKKAGIELTNIKFVLEDRNSMVQKWRELGLTCLQVADGNY